MYKLQTQQIAELTSEQVWQVFHKQLLSFIQRRINSREDAEDILQDVFIKIHQSITSLKEAETLKSWLYRITQTQLLIFIVKEDHCLKLLETNFLFLRNHKKRKI